jgi:hypothetical protein
LEWSTDDLIGSWTLVGEDWRLVGNKSGATRLGFALILKYFEIEARFPFDADSFPPVAISYVAEQVKVDPAELAKALSAPLTDVEIARHLPTLDIQLGDQRRHIKGKLREYVSL